MIKVSDARSIVSFLHAPDGCGFANRSGAWMPFLVLDLCRALSSMFHSGMSAFLFRAISPFRCYRSLLLIRRTDTFSLEVYDRLKKKTEELQQEMPAYVKKIIEKNL